MPRDKYLKPALILCLICLVTTGLLSLTYSMTREAREMQESSAADADRQSLFPDAAAFEPFEDQDLTQFPGLTEACRVKDAGGVLIGYLVTARYRGYGGDVPVMVAFTPDGYIMRLKVLSNDETPGLGKNAGKDTFLRQFIGLGTDKALSVKPHDGEKYLIDAVSGATISSNAVTQAVNAAIGFVRHVCSEVT